MRNNKIKKKYLITKYKLFHYLIQKGMTLFSKNTTLQAMNVKTILDIKKRNIAYYIINLKSIYKIIIKIIKYKNVLEFTKNILQNMRYGFRIT